MFNIVIYNLKQGFPYLQYTNCWNLISLIGECFKSYVTADLPETEQTMTALAEDHTTLRASNKLPSHLNRLRK